MLQTCYSEPNRLESWINRFNPPENYIEIGKKKTDTCISVRKQAPRTVVVKGKGFQDLPSKLLQKVFSYLDQNDLRHSVIPTCRNWRNAALQPEFWQCLHFRGSKAPIFHICQQLRTIPTLQCIRLVEISEISTVVRQICRYNTHLKSITIKSCNNSYEGDTLTERLLRFLISNCTKLAELNLKGTHFKASVFYIELSSLQDLKSLNLSGNPLMTIRNLSSVVLNCHKLEEFRLSRRIGLDRQISNKEAYFIFANLAENIKSLTFDMTGLNDLTFQAVLNCNKLERLHLNNSGNLSPETFHSIWKKLPNLYHLAIRNAHQLTGNDFIILFTDGFEVMKKLKVLDIKGCWKVGNAGIEAVAATCFQLEKLGLSCCKSLSNLSCLKATKKLKSLNVAFCNSLQSLEKVVDDLPLLGKLVVDKHTDEAMLDGIQQRRPSLIIKVYISEYNKKKYIF